MWAPTRRDLRLARELTKLDRFDLLVLDDLSYVRRDQAEISVLFEPIAERYERKSIAITANTPFSQWAEVLVDTAMTVAAVHRLVHHSTILEMNVESYRRRAAHEAKAPANMSRFTTRLRLERVDDVSRDRRGTGQLLDPLVQESDLAGKVIMAPALLVLGVPRHKA